ncbi:Armadillo repeat-containing protein 8, partial [Tupaia chinensis]
IDMKNAVIGNNKQKANLIVLGAVPRLLYLLQQETSSTELKTECAVVLGSLAMGTENNVKSLLDCHIIPALLQGLLSPDLKFIEACLRCLRTIFTSPVTPEELLYTDATVIPHLMALLSRSRHTQEYICQIFSHCCKVRMQALKCFSVLAFENPQVSMTLVNVLVDGELLPQIFVKMLQRDKPIEMQLTSAKCLTYMCRAGAIRTDDNCIVLKTLPCLVRMCSKERLLEERVEGAETLAYLIEPDVELQRIASITDHLIAMLADYFKYPSSVSAITDIKRLDHDLKHAHELRQAAFKLYASLGANDEDIRKKTFKWVRGSWQLQSPAPLLAWKRLRRTCFQTFACPVTTLILMPVLESGRVVPSVYAVASAPSVHAVFSAPSVHVVASAHSVHVVFSAPSGHAVVSAPSVHAVFSVPSVHAVASAPSGHAVVSAPSVHAVFSVPSVHAVASAPSGHAAFISSVRRRERERAPSGLKAMSDAQWTLVPLSTGMEDCSINLFLQIIETENMMDRIVTGLSESSVKVRLAAVRCLHSLSRSVQQLRTSFQDHAVWKPLMKVLQNAPDEILVVASSMLCNLLLEFSPSKEHIDKIMSTHGKQIMQAVTLILEGEHNIEVKEQTLCILANIADGTTAKELIMTNDDILQKIKYYMGHSHVKLQLAAMFCVSNLIWNEEEGSQERQDKLRDMGIVDILHKLSQSPDSNLCDKYTPSAGASCWTYTQSDR